MSLWVLNVSIRHRNVYIWECESKRNFVTKLLMWVLSTGVVVFYVNVDVVVFSTVMACPGTDVNIFHRHSRNPPLSCLRRLPPSKGNQIMKRSETFYMTKCLWLDCQDTYPSKMHNKGWNVFFCIRYSGMVFSIDKHQVEIHVLTRVDICWRGLTSLCLKLVSR